MTPRIPLTLSNQDTNPHTQYPFSSNANLTFSPNKKITNPVVETNNNIKFKAK